MTFCGCGLANNPHYPKSLPALDNFVTVNPPRHIMSTIAVEKMKAIFKSSKKSIEKKTCLGIHRPWGENLISQEQAINKMAKNLSKAWREHYYPAITTPLPQRSPHSFSQSEYKKDEKQLKTPDFLSAINPISSNNAPISSISYGFVSEQWVRPSMQDAHFCINLSNGMLIGILDGHGDQGKEIADFVSARIQKLFPKILKKHASNVHQAFEEIFSKVQKEVILSQAFEKGGCTAAISFIDPEKRIIINATLGDSEAKIYREINNELISIPLSCVRHWGSPKDINRARIATQGEYEEPVDLFWKNNNVPVRLRRIERMLRRKMKNNLSGINVSRAFGDHAHNANRPIDTIIAKPKITSCRLNPGDLIVHACDGLYGCEVLEKNEQIIVDRINCFRHLSPTKISQELMELAKTVGKSTDNITVQTLKIE